MRKALAAVAIALAAGFLIYCISLFVYRLEWALQA